MADQGSGGFAAIGVPGLDEVLGGGLIRSRSYLLEGAPGTGKTTLALQFLLEGTRRGERGVYFTLSETAEELAASAASHGWTLDGAFKVVEIVPPESLFDDSREQTLLYSSDLELGETARTIFDEVERHRPSRIVLDSLSELRLLAQSSLRYRRQILAMKHFLVRCGATALMLDDLTAEAGDKTMHSIAHGVIRLEELAPAFGAERRRLRVSKYRGQRFRGGFHDFEIETGGVRAFPRLVAAQDVRHGFRRERLGTGLPEFDRLLGGGLERGTSTLIVGPAGAGKSLLALCTLAEAVRRGEKAALFVFDEEVRLLTDRAVALGIDLDAMRRSGQLSVQQVDAAELSPGAFAHAAATAADAGAGTVVIDSLNGYNNAMPEERDLVLHMHELLQHLNRRGVVSLVTVAQHGLVGDMRSPVDITYLSDTVVLIRFFEAFGRVRRAVSVMKKRAGPHEDTIRELRFADGSVAIGPPLSEFQGVLRGVPTYVGAEAPLMSPPRP
ncbi:MAG: AAA family ATPase [Acetobacteraceae bacterium]|nr:AAA family ATPase [Acetobacteraceae bacterium]